MRGEAETKCGFSPEDKPNGQGVACWLVLYWNSRDAIVTLNYGSVTLVL